MISPYPLNTLIASTMRMRPVHRLIPLLSNSDVTYLRPLLNQGSLFGYVWVSYLISAILVPPFPIIQPISSLGTVISCVCVPGDMVCWQLGTLLNWFPAIAANAKKEHIVWRRNLLVVNVFNIVIVIFKTQNRKGKFISFWVWGGGRVGPFFGYCWSPEKI